MATPTSPSPVGGQRSALAVCEVCVPCDPPPSSDGSVLRLLIKSGDTKGGAAASSQLVSGSLTTLRGAASSGRLSFIAPRLPAQDRVD